MRETLRIMDNLAIRLPYQSRLRPEPPGSGYYT